MGLGILGDFIKSPFEYPKLEILYFINFCQF